jgi:hypothetical protein
VLVLLLVSAEILTGKNKTFQDVAGKLRLRPWHHLLISISAVTPEFFAG